MKLTDFGLARIYDFCTLLTSVVSVVCLLFPLDDDDSSMRPFPFPSILRSSRFGTAAPRC